MTVDNASQRTVREWLRLCFGSETDRRNQLRFITWLLAWAVTFVAATWLVSRGKVTGPLAWGVAVLPTVLGIAAVLAYLRFLRMADELVRRIQLEGLALGFGAGALFTAGYPLFQGAGAPTLGMDDVLAVMMISWALGQFLAMRRFR